MTMDYSDYQEENSSEDALARLSKMADEQAVAEADVVKAEEALKEAQAKLKDLAEVKIPALMDEVGLKDFKTASGLKVKLDEKMHASIPKEKAISAFSWLEEHEHGDLIKRKFIIEFGRDEEEEAKVFKDKIEALNLPLDVEEKKEVHHTTLSAFVKEQLEAGVDIPLDLFGAFWRRKAKIG